MGEKNIINSSYEKFKKIFAIYLTAILIAGGFFGFAKNASAYGSGSYPAPKNGDWVIENETKVWNETIVLNGNLTIEDSGNLTLKNVTLIMNCTEDGEFIIEVKDGGKLYIFDYDNNPNTLYDRSNITSYNSDYEFKFLVNSGSEFEMRNSELSECGYNFIGDDGRKGLTIKTNNTIIENSNFYHNYYGICLWDSNYCDITNNNIYSNDNDAIYVRKSGDNIIKDNTIYNNSAYGIYIYESNNNRMLNNNISNNHLGIGFLDSYNNFAKNNSIYSNIYGFQFYSSSNNTITNTNIFYSNISVYLKNSNNNRIFNSTISDSIEYDFNLSTSSDISLINTTFNKDKVYFEDENSTLTVQWYLDVKVEDTNNAPIFDALVTVENKSSSEIFNGKTDIDGWIKGIICTEYTQNKNERINNTPHNVSVEKEGYTFDWTNVEFTPPNNQNQKITLTIFELPKPQIGHSVSYAGDINNDDFEDVIVGAPYDDTNENEAGAAYLFYGYSSFEPSELDMKDANVTFYGSGAFENFGYSVSGAGDINNDNFDDIIVGAPNATVNGKRRGNAYIFFGSNSMNKTIYSTEANGKFSGMNIGEKFGSSVVGIGNVNGDEFDDFIISGFGANKAYLIYGNKSLKEDIIFFADLWDDDGDGIIDFTDNTWDDLQTDNTWGIDGDDDGWDTCPFGIYGGSETQVRYNPSNGATGQNRDISNVDELQIEIGGGSNNGDQRSGAYGIEINISQELYDVMDSAILKFDWKLMEYGHEDDEQLWLKARFGNSTQMTYLGTNQDSGADASNEILYFVGDGGTHTRTGTFNEDISYLITEPGTYYLELGGKNTAWTTGGEYMVACYDNIDFLRKIEYGSPRSNLTGENMGDNFGFSVSLAGDVNKDTYADFIIGAPNFDDCGKVYLYYGHENMSKNLTANSTITGEEQHGQFGFSIDTAGDMNGDGYDDIIIGAPESGKSYIYYGGVGGIDYGTILLDSTEDFKKGTPDNVSIGSDEVKLGISGNIVPNGFFDDDWQQWSFSGGAKRHDTSSPNGMVNVVTGDWKVGPMSGGPTAGFGSDRDTIGDDNNADRQCDGRLRSAAFTIPSDVDYLHLWYHWKINDFDSWGSADGVRLRLYDASNDNELMTFAEHMASGNGQDWEDEEELIPDISLYHGYSVYIELRIICNNGNRDKALAQIDDIYSCDSAGNPADPSLFGNYTSKIFKTEAIINGIIPTWEETLNDGEIIIKFRADSSVSWDDAQIANNNEELIFDVPGNEVQFNAFFSTPNNETTPILHKISFEYYSNKNQTVIIGSAEDKFGYSVSYGADINNDGYSEIIIGEPFNNVNGNNAGAAYVFYGDAPMSTILTTNEAFSTYYGDASENHFGFSVSNAGNIDNLNMSEIIIGAPFYENKKGISYVIGVKEDDVGVLVINNPKEGNLFDPDQNLKINVTIANFGINSQINFKVKLIITCTRDSNNDYSADLMISKDLLPGKKIFREFNWTIPKEDSYSYEIKVFTELTGDMESKNDEKSVNIIVRGTDFTPLDLSFKRNDGKWITEGRRLIANQTATIIVNVTNNGNIFGENVNVSFFDDANLINYNITDISVSEIITIEINWKPTEGEHEITVEIDPNGEFIEYDETNNKTSQKIIVNPNIPQESFIFWAQVNYNWGSKARVIDAPVTVKNNKGEIIAINRTSMFTLGLWEKYEDDLTSGPVKERIEDAFENNGYPISGSAIINKIDDKKWELTNGDTIYVIEEEGQHLNVYNKKIRGKCRFELNETQYLEGDKFEIIATNPIINEGEPKEEILEGTYFNTTTIFAYSNDSNDDDSEPIHFKLECYGLIIGSHGDIYDKETKIGSAAIYKINVKVAPDGNENEIVYFELPNLPNNWTVFISGEGVTYIDGKYMKTVGLDNQVFNLIVIPENPIHSEYVLKTELIATIESNNVPKYSMIFTTNVEKTEINLTIDGNNKSTKTVNTGEIVKYELSIKNKGTDWDEVSLSFSGKNSNWAYLSKSWFWIKKGETEIVELIVEVPETAKYPESSIIEIYAISKDGNVSKTVTSITNVMEKISSVELITTEYNESNGNWTKYFLKLINNGSFDEFVSLKVDAPEKWNAKLSDPDIFLGIGDQTFINLTIFHPLEEKDWGEVNDIKVTASYGYNEDLDIFTKEYDMTIENKPPFAYIIIDKKDLKGGKLTIDSKIIADPNNSIDEDNSTLKYFWDFGDGTKSNDENPTHEYKNAGNYTINLTVEDKHGLIDFAIGYDVRIWDVYSPIIKVFYVLNESINLEEEEIIKVTTNEILILDASKSFDRDGYIVSYSWDFGDENKEYGKIVNWNYTKPGDYEIILTVKDSSGKIKKLTIYVNVTKPTELEDIVSVKEDGIASWLFYSIILIIVFLVLMIFLVFTKIKTVSFEVNNAKMNSENSKFVEQEFIEPKKPPLKTEEEKIKEEFKREENEIVNENIFPFEKENDFNMKEDEKIEEPIKEDKVEIEKEEDFGTEETFHGEEKIEEPIKEEKKEKPDKKIEDEDDWWSKWGEESNL